MSSYTQDQSSLRVLPHRQYDSPDHLDPATVPADPLEHFRVWFRHAVDAGVHDPEAVALATASPSAVPSNRIVLFKLLDARGFIFYTNYTSRKSNEISANPHAALVFYWPQLHRSVRVVGAVEPASPEQSDDYFRSRPRDSQLGAWASEQSAVIDESRLQDRLQQVHHRFADGPDVPRPEFWGGWRVVPREIEFWCGKPSRLHDRVRYLRVEGSPDDHSKWTIERLAP